MDRVAAAATILRKYRVSSVLDVGCRDGRLKGLLPESVSYFGCDLEPAPHVAFAGDVTELEFGRRFDGVVALDVLEHIDELHAALDKLVGLMGRTLIVSLPNCFDLKNRIRFVGRGRLSAKYELRPEPSLDRHRWLVGYPDAVRLFNSAAVRHGLRLDVELVSYGGSQSGSLWSLLGRWSRVLGPTLTAEAVIGVFSRTPQECGSRRSALGTRL